MEFVGSRSTSVIGQPLANAAHSTDFRVALNSARMPIFVGERRPFDHGEYSPSDANHRFGRTHVRQSAHHDSLNVATFARVGDGEAQPPPGRATLIWLREPVLPIV